MSDPRTPEQTENAKRIQEEGERVASFIGCIRREKPLDHPEKDDIAGEVRSGITYVITDVPYSIRTTGGFREDLFLGLSHLGCLDVLGVY